jgi:enoyl-CoA hydratase/carnithine racemase
MTHLTCTFDHRVATIMLDNAPQNRIGDQMVDELDAATACIASSDARAVLLRASGPDFSFGGDILPWPNRSRSELRATFEHYMNVFNRFERLPLPVVAAVQGVCFGGGLELTVRADVMFASSTARFGHPEQTLGIVDPARRHLPRCRAGGPGACVGMGADAQAYFRRRNGARRRRQ